MVIKRQSFSNLCSREGERGVVKVINCLLVATAILKISKTKITILIKKEKLTDNARYAAAFSTSITSRPCRKNI